MTGAATSDHMCNCIGPQNGQPKCPCQMRGLIQRDGRWIQPEVDLGPVTNTPHRLDAGFTMAHIGFGEEPK